MQRTFFSLLMLACTLAVSAVPAKRVQRTICVGGQELTVTLTGDEYLHYWQAADGSAYEEQADGSYALLDLTASRNKARAQQAPQQRTAAHVEPIIGEKRGLVILVNTQDMKFTCSDDPNQLFSDMMNQQGFSYGKATGSVRDYFRDQSYALLDYRFDVVGPVTVSHDMSYYGNNNAYAYESCVVGEMVSEAVALADEEVDFSQYDCDGDGEVENIYVIYAGYSEAAGAPKWTIWPHAYRLSYINYWNKGVNAITCDGVRVDAYACSSEFRGTQGTSIDGIGTICHEFSHCLGLPDFYSTVNAHNDYTNAYWSLLDTGTYGNDGDTPCSYTAYERWFCGWIEPVELKNDTTVHGLTNLDKSERAYVYYNEGNRNEFYILHNIQKEGWNTYAYDHGLAIFHVDVDNYAWEYNEVNNYPDHLRMQLVCADNTYSWNSVWEDLYPNSNGNNKLNDTSMPACKVFNQNIDGTYSMGKYLTNINETAKGSINFRFTVSQSIKDITGITSVSPDARPASQQRYNLAGQPVTGKLRGIVVTQDGKKILQR